ncbi:hypothetical protein B0H19DRAFT_1167351 [Mycena capillaripes]|nr:hypothetical protein B0H19DRAFT_1167351 [Mycena capillaripes]
MYTYTWPVFITAVRPPKKVLNRAFLLIQDFQFLNYPADSLWTLLTSRNLLSKALPATPLPLPDFIAGNNDFASMSLADISTFIRANQEALSGIISTMTWLIIDQKGLETFTCLGCVTEWAGVMSSMPVGFGTRRRGDAGVQEDGSWRWESFGPQENDPEEKTEAEIKKEKALKELRDAGQAD